MARVYGEDTTVIILDIRTGQHRLDGEYDTIFWESGNGRCDCERSMSFEYALETMGRASACLGSRRFVIVESTAGDINKMNAEYPIETVELAFKIWNG